MPFAKKSLSQNFLIDSSVIQKILTLAAPTSSDTLLEIGPGRGALTLPLLATGAHLFAVEKDRDLARALHRLQTPDHRLHLFEGDFLTFPLETLPPPLKVIANLPYHITAPLLEKLLPRHDLFTSLTLMLQKEVVDRMCASPHTKDYSPLTLFTQYHARIHSTFLVPATSFSPRPGVDSKVIRLDLTPPPPSPPHLFPLLRAAFQHRRKLLTSTLPYPKPLIASTLAHLGYRPDSRPEQLSLPEWIALAEALPPL